MGVLVGWVPPFKGVGGRVRPCVLIFLLSLSPVYCFRNDDDDFESDGHLRADQVAYGGMTFTCNYGCGDPDSNPRFNEISSILRVAIDRVFVCPSPLYFGWGPLKEHLAYPFHPWQREWYYKFSVYDWEKAKGFYLSENPRKEYSFASYADFLELASLLRKDVHFYSIGVYEQELKFSRSALSSIRQVDRQGVYGNVEFDEQGQLEFYDWGTSTSESQNIDECMKDLKNRIKKLKEQLLDYYPCEYEKNVEIIEEAIRKVDDKFWSIFIKCLERHQPEGLAFNGAIEGLIGQDFYQAMDQIHRLIGIAEKHQVEDEFLSKLYLLKGQLDSEYGLYAEAIIGLTTAIQKNPQMKDAYFERAAAFFEMGQFDQAIEDYLISRVRPSYFESSSQLGLGIASGIVIGAKASSLEFIPTMLGTAQGLGAGIWALVKSPVATSQEFVNAAVQCIEYIQSHSTIEVVQDMVPELRELIHHSHQLDDFQKGKLIGHVIGKYGMDVFLVKQSVTFLKAYQNLKKANKVLTLDAIASSGRIGPILADTERRWSNIHIEAIRNGEVKIIESKQGKHIVGHNNYEYLIKKGESPSILTHPDPQKLLVEYGGTGIKAHDSFETATGMVGYKEIVDFKQVIGYAVEQGTKGKMATTLGKIHYAKDGAHIVPFVKR